MIKITQYEDKICQLTWPAAKSISLPLVTQIRFPGVVGWTSLPHGRFSPREIQD